MRASSDSARLCLPRKGDSSAFSQIRTLFLAGISFLKKHLGIFFWPLLSVGLGQYAQHSCCFDHVNAHIFPMFTLREEAGSTELRQGEDGEWMQLQEVALRANRLIKEGEEILIQYVGSGRSGHFRKVFDCTCCWCSGRSNTGSHLSDSVWADMLEQTRQVEALTVFQRLERQIVTDKRNLLKM